MSARDYSGEEFAGLGGLIAEWLRPVSFTLFGFEVAHLQVLFVLTGLLRLSCLLPLIWVVDVERPPEGYVVLRALQTRMPFRAFLDTYRLLQLRVRRRARKNSRGENPTRGNGPADSGRP